MPKTTRLSRTAAFLAGTFLLACAQNGTDDAPPPQGPQPSPGPVTVESVSPRSGEPGTDVTVQASGFQPNQTVEIGFGPPRSEYDVVETVQADAYGNVSASVTVPSWAERGEPYLFVVTAPSDEPKATSEPFFVTTPEGRVRVQGEITDEGVECLAVRQAFTDDLYTLAGGDTEGLEAGDRVVVEGSLAEMSFCQQGTTIEVASIERR